MRTLGLDIGDVRCGIAVSDPQGRVASPVCVLPTPEVMAGAKSFQRVLEDWEPELLVFGMPRSLDGVEGKQAQHIRTCAEAISTSCGLPYEFIDERLSSKEAKRTLHELGYDEKRMRGKVDMIAASLFLQTWLDLNTRDD